MTSARWAKRVRWTLVPDRFNPFYTKGKTHRGAHKLEEPGWYFLDILDLLCGPYASRAVAEEAVSLSRLATL